MRFLRSILGILLSTILLLITCNMAFAQNDLVEKWEPTQYVEENLNVKSFFVLQTEYPTYKTGTKSLFLLITNRVYKELLFGPAFTLEKKMPDGWHTQKLSSVDPKVVLVWKSDAYDVAPKSKKGFSINFGLPLVPGEYRIIKSIGINGKSNSDALSCAYFTVADNGYDAAYLSGYTPLASLPKYYPMSRALQDGVFYTDDEDKAYNADHLIEFLTKVSQGVSAKLRVEYDGKEGGYTLTDIIYLPEQSCFCAESRSTDTGIDSSVRSIHATSIYRNYYRFLNTVRKGDKTMLVLADWIGKPVAKAGGLNIVYDVSAIGASKITSLLYKIYGKNPDPAHQVYGKDPNTFVSYTNDDGTHIIHYTLTGRSIKEAVIADSRDMIRDLLDIEWTKDNRILLTFSTSKRGLECRITFDPVLDRIVQSEYK